VIGVGDLVYLHSDLNKSRDRYLVVAMEPPFWDIKKFIGSQLRRRSSSYHVKLSECFKVPCDLADPLRAPLTLQKRLR